MIIREEQKKQMVRGILAQKLQAAFMRDVPGFKTLSDSDRQYFISEAMTIADAVGFKSEQGIASYAMAIWWLGVDFESKSKKLQEVLESKYPEVRRIHAMNEWVDAAIGDPESIAAADAAIEQSLELTKPWGAGE